MKPNPEDNVTPFTGNRMAPTPNDWAQLEEFVEDLLELVKKKEINSLSWVATLTHTPAKSTSDWLMLPGTQGHIVNSALSIQQRAFELALMMACTPNEETD